MNSTSPIRILTAAIILFGAVSAQAQEAAAPATTEQPATAEQPKAASQASAAETSAMPAAKLESAPSASASSITDEDKKMIKQGYQIKVRDGEKLYCKRQTTSGSRLNTKDVCLRPEEMKVMREDAQDAMREKIRSNKSL